MKLLYVFCVALILITIISIVLLISERVKQHRNPIPKLQNHDKRFSEIASIYGQKMFRVNRGK